MRGISVAACIAVVVVGVLATAGSCRAQDGPFPVELTVLTELTPSSYHWQARAVDSSGRVSAFVSFGGNPETAADFVVLNVPLTGLTRGMINRQSIAHMKPGALLINVARGPVVVEADLVAALETGQLAEIGRAHV